MTDTITTEEPPVVTVDVQDPLPEQDWFWRRSFSFGLSIACIGFIWYGIEALWDLKQAEAIYRVTRYMIGILAMVILFYMVAPSAEQIVKLIQAAKTLRAGIPMTRTARVVTPTGTTETQSTAGVAVDAPEAPTPAPAPSPAAEEDFAPRSQT